MKKTQEVSRELFAQAVESVLTDIDVITDSDNGAYDFAEKLKDYEVINEIAVRQVIYQGIRMALETGKLPIIISDGENGERKLMSLREVYESPFKMGASVLEEKD